jgi:hypothetical protein
MSTLKSRLDLLASTFAAEVVRAIQSSSLDELLGDVGGGRRGPGRTNGSVVAASAPALPRARATKPGRLPRRSADDIAEALDKVVALVKKHKQGLRAEQIRTQLRMQAKEMPRILKEGIAKKALKSRGQKRATTYFAA